MMYVIIGDIHGCIEELQELWDLLPTNSQKIFVGDLIDRGPNSAACVHFARTHDALMVMGNHDLKLAKRHQRGSTGSHPVYDLLDREYIASAPYYIQQDGIMVVHAGIYPHLRDLPQMDEINFLSNNKKGKYQTMMYVRYVHTSGHPASNVFAPGEGLTPWGEVYDGRFGHVYYGHEPYTYIQRYPHATGIDLGCVFGGSLCAVVLEDGVEVDVVTVKAHQIYASRTHDPGN